jgi:serine/threonine protein phosphatase PrpC
MQDAVNGACTVVYDRAHGDPLLRRMGATLVAAVILGPHLYLANVGDSRAYLINQNGINRLTVDDTVIAQLIERGDLDEDKARDHPAQGELTRNIGSKPRAEIHFHYQKLASRDVLMLCCDGLTDVIEDEEIRDIILAADTSQEACRDLVNLANRRGGPDNVTLIVTAYNPDVEATNGQ